MTYEVFRDAWGIPHVRAGSLSDLAYGQGFNAATDRGEQIELERLRSVGGTAATFGEAALSWDCFARRSMIDETARLSFERLDDETKSFIGAYVDGVNAGLGSDAWRPWTPLGVFLVQQILFGSFPSKLWQARLTEALGEEAIALFGHEGPALSGSNAWAVGGARTSSGSPLIGGDPHRMIESPGVYQQVHLSCPEFDVVGFAFPGVPGVAHFAHAGGVAWAITNAMGDYQDLYPEQLRRAGEGVEALGTDGWYAADMRRELIEVKGGEGEEIEVITTRNGPVIVGGVNHAESMSLRTASYIGRDLGFGAMLPLLRARTAEDVDRAFDLWVEPVNNVVIADVHGDIRFRVAGLVPTRDEGFWTGWVDLPPEHFGPGDQVVTANERRGPESAAIGSAFAPPHRADRIKALLEGRTGLTGEDFAAIHADTLSIPALRLQELLASLDDLSPEAGAARDRIVAWDGRMDSGSAGAGELAAWRSAFVRLIAARPVFDPLRETSPYPELFDPWLALTPRVAHGLLSLIAAGTPFGINLTTLAAEALEGLGETGAWGDTHTALPLTGLAQFGIDASSPVPPIPLSGDAECVLCTSSIPGVTDLSSRGSVARYVWDLADRNNSRWIVPLGASGTPGDPHFDDQLEPWAACELVPVLTDWDLLAKDES